MDRMPPSPLRLLLVASVMLGIAASRLCAQSSIEGTVAVSGKPMAPAPTSHYALKAGEIAPSPKQLAVVWLEGSFNKGAPTIIKGNLINRSKRAAAARKHSPRNPTTRPFATGCAPPEKFEHRALHGCACADGDHAGFDGAWRGCAHGSN
jgi:hypothetical protein